MPLRAVVVVKTTFDPEAEPDPEPEVEAPLLLPAELPLPEGAPDADPEVETGVETPETIASRLLDVQADATPALPMSAKLHAARPTRHPRPISPGVMTRARSVAR